HHTERRGAKTLGRQWGLSLGFVAGEAVHPPRPRGRGLCALVQARETGEAACCEHTANTVGGSSVCWAGLRELAVPLVAGGETVGAFIAGGYVLAEEAETALDESARRIGRLRLAPDALARTSHPRPPAHHLGMVDAPPRA